MEHNEDRNSLKNVPTSTLPPPPRFDAAASAAARPVEPLAKAGFLTWPNLNTKYLRVNRRSKLLALTAIVGLATGAAGGMLVVQRDQQQRLVNSSSMIQVPGEQPGTPEVAASPTADNDAKLELAEPMENRVRVRRNQRRARKNSNSEMVVLSDADDENRDKHDDDGKDKNDDARKKNRGNQDRAVLYDVLRARKP